MDDWLERFRDATEGRAPRPPAAATLGWELVEAKPAQGTMTLRFTATEDFTNPSGNVLGAFLAAMLYDTVGPTLIATLDPDQFQSTVELNVHFLRPARPGRLTGEGRVLRRDGNVAHLEAKLIDEGNQTIATATATALVIPLSEAASAV